MKKIKNNVSVDGLNYRLRLVRPSDSEFIIGIRTEDQDRNKYINTISKNKETQEKWIGERQEDCDDYYFIIENLFTDEREGTIAVYNIKNNTAEWGRWVLKKGSMAAIESVDLIMKFSFNTLGLSEIYRQTICDNIPVIEFHNAIRELKRGVIKNNVTINNIQYDSFEHYVPTSHYYSNIQPLLEEKAYKIFRRSLSGYFGSLDFHHLGLATKNIEKEFATYRLFGYQRESEIFIDPIQGIRGLFISHEKQPRIELLENLDGSTVLDRFIDSGVKIYHIAYMVDDINKAIQFFKERRSFLISEPQESVYFNSKICFLVLPNRSIIELVERTETNSNYS